MHLNLDVHKEPHKTPIESRTAVEVRHLSWQILGEEDHAGGDLEGKNSLDGIVDGHCKRVDGC